MSNLTEDEKTGLKVAVSVGGGLLIGFLGLLMIPIIAPLAAGSGLVGAAAFTSGLATIGGGSIAAGGFGMAGGVAVIGTTGIITGSAAGYGVAKAIVD